METLTIFKPRSSTVHWRFIALLMMGTAWLAPHASAQSECLEDADCDHGFACETFEPACVGPASVECSTDPVSVCVLGPCETAADCAEGVACVHGAERSSCVPAWELPCEMDEDCGQGFLCIDEEHCWTRGGSGSSEAGGEPSEPESGCELTGDRVCQWQETPCEMDEECLAGWQCGVHPGRNVCGGGTSNPPADAGVPADDLCGQEVRSTVCVPPEYPSREGIGAGAPGGALDGEVNRGTASAPTEQGDDVTASSPSGGCQLGGGLGAGNPLAFLVVCLALGAMRRRAGR